MRLYSSSIWLVLIGFFHVALALCSTYALWIINADETGLPRLSDSERLLWMNAALIGFIGSLLYFGRKAYVYLITEKFRRLEAELVQDGAIDQTMLEQRMRGKIIGYYMYLSLRPFAGLVIGPAVAMIILGGVTTLTKSSGTGAGALSQPGLLLIYLFSLIGGYTSSDMFDYLSKSGKRFISKAKVE
jgi:hypothetical protein